MPKSPSAIVCSRRSASQPTDVSSMSNDSATIPPTAPQHWPRSPAPGNAWPECGSPTRTCKPCSRCCACSGVCQENLINRDLREHLDPLLGRLPGTFSSGQGTYDLRRLRHHGLIERVPHSHRYRVTNEGHRQALFLSRTHHLLLIDGLAEFTEPMPTSPRSLRAASNAYDHAIDDLLNRAGLAA